VNYRKYRTSHTVAAVDWNHMFVDLKTSNYWFYIEHTVDLGYNIRVSIIGAIKNMQILKV
jgi:hypothetical protein